MPKFRSRERRRAFSPAPPESIKVPSMSQRRSVFTAKPLTFPGVGYLASRKLSKYNRPMKTASLFLSIIVMAFCAGCATPEARIQKNPEVFAKLPPNEQQLIREGKVGIGFT